MRKAALDAEDAYGDLLDNKTRTPTAAVYQAMKSTLLRLLEEGQLDAAGARELQRLTMPQPDTTPVTQAMTGIGMAATLPMGATAYTQLPSPAAPKRKAKAAEVWAQRVEVDAHHAEALLKAAIQHAVAHNAPASKVTSMLAIAQLWQQWAQHLIFHAERFELQYGPGPDWRERLQERQKQLVAAADEAAEWAEKAARKLGNADKAASAAAALAAGQALHKLIKQRSAPTEEERSAVIAAVLEANVDLRGMGYTGTGHMNRCPNGHVYFIGACGGAVHTARCAECGATIGGSSHRLAEGNAPARAPG